MMRKLLFASVLFLLLTGCAASSSATPTPEAPTAVTTFTAPDQSLATQVFGTATVLMIPGAKGIFLRSQPKPKAPVAGEVKPGDSGKVLGIDSSGAWMYVEIKGQSGWVPVQYLDYTIAQ
jgi:uncharacterized protein YgiM (DUF1202 family)